MKFMIEVGNQPTNQIEYNFNQLLGRLVIKLNQKEVKRTTRLFNEPVKEEHLVQIPGFKDLTVRIEKERRPLLGQKCRVLLNGRLFRCFSGV